MNLTILPKKRITTALLLAAGTGSRLYPLTKSEPKCMTMVNGTSILERLISNLNDHGFKRLVIVTGHLEHCIRNFLGNQIGDLKIEYIFSPLYKTTNNIYSLWVARKLIHESFLLLESDLIFDSSLLKEMLEPDRIASAVRQPWMDGTCIKIDKAQNVQAFIAKNAEEHQGQLNKTVNIYSISNKSWSGIVKNLEKSISEGNVNDYYEAIFSNMVSDHSLSFKNVSFDNQPWYEIDTLEDLVEAEKLFPKIKKTLSITNTKDRILNFPQPDINVEAFQPRKVEAINARK